MLIAHQLLTFILSARSFAARFSSNSKTQSGVADDEPDDLASFAL